MTRQTPGLGSRLNDCEREIMLSKIQRQQLSLFPRYHKKNAASIATTELSMMTMMILFDQTDDNVRIDCRLSADVIRATATENEKI